MHKVETMINLSNTKHIEHMADVTDAQIADAVKKYYLSDEFIKNISIVSAQIQQNGLTVPGNLKVDGNILTAGSSIMECAGRQHMTGSDMLYLLHKNGVIIGKEWGGTGDIQVQGNVFVQGRNILAEIDALKSSAVTFDRNIWIRANDTGRPLQANPNDMVVRAVSANIGGWETFSIKRA